MKKTLIRRGTFETNSSSCHTLTLSGGVVFPTQLPGVESNITLNQDTIKFDFLSIHGEIDDDDGNVTDFQTKLAFYISSVLIGYHTQSLKELYDSPNFKLLSKVLTLVYGKKDFLLFNEEGLTEEEIANIGTIRYNRNIFESGDAFDLECISDVLTLHKFLFSTNCSLRYEYN